MHKEYFIEVVQLEGKLEVEPESESDNKPCIDVYDNYVAVAPPAEYWLQETQRT